MYNLIDQWRRHLSDHRGYSAASVGTYARAAMQFVDWLAVEQGVASPDQVTREHVLAFMEFLFYTHHNSNSTRSAKLSAVRSFFEYLVYAHKIAVDPTFGVPSPRIQELVPRKFTDDQLRKLFASPDQTTTQGVRDRAILVTLYASGIRMSELWGLDLGDVEDSGRSMKLTVQGKGGRQRVLLIGREPSAVLRAWMILRTGIETPSSALFVVLRGQPHRLGKRSIPDVLKKYASAVGIRSVDAFLHKFRATWATQLYDQGVGLLEICAKAGWKDTKTAMRYITISDRALRQATIDRKQWRNLFSGEVQAERIEE